LFCKICKGTEDILKTIDRPDEVFFASTHLYGDGFYPGSGICDNIEHNIINLPITPMWLCSEVNSTNDCDFTGRSSFRRQIVSRLLPALRAFSPDIVFVSAGFDGCKVSKGFTLYFVYCLAIHDKRYLNSMILVIKEMATAQVLLA